MNASLALRSRCCSWHAHYHAPQEHARCVVCDQLMPLVLTSFAGLPAEHICARCSLALRVEFLRLAPAPRFLRRQPVPRRAS